MRKTYIGSKNKHAARLRRARRMRMHTRKLGKKRMVVKISNRNIYAQIIDDSTGQSMVLAQSSTKDKQLRDQLTGKPMEKAHAVGKSIGERAIAKGVKTDIVFDRSGFRYHGLVKALAEGAREAGIEF